MSPVRHAVQPHPRNRWYRRESRLVGRALLSLACVYLACLVGWLVGWLAGWLPACLLACLPACSSVPARRYRRIIYSDRRELGFMINERRATTLRGNQLRATALDTVCMHAPFPSRNADSPSTCSFRFLSSFFLLLANCLGRWTCPLLNKFETEGEILFFFFFNKFSHMRENISIEGEQNLLEIE